MTLLDILNVTTGGTSSALAPYYQASRPASVMANPTLLAFSIFGLLGGTLLALESVWRMSQMLRERRYALHHPATLANIRILLSAIAVLLYIGPDAVVFMTWPDVSPASRHMIGLINRCLDAVAWLPFSAGWLLGIYSAKAVDHQLAREPIPVDLWMPWRDLRRPAMIGFLVLLASLALSFGR